MSRAHQDRRRQRVARRLGVVLAFGLLTLPVVGAQAAPTQADVETRQVAVGPEPDGTAVSLDVDVHRPAETQRAPAVILGHGFGGSKDDLTERAERLAGEGFVVVSYSARGFGDSGGRVHLNDPAYEIADVQVLIDGLGDDEQVRQDSDGDPRVAVVGGSYGGAMALMAAGADERIDSVVASITWNDLGHAFYPQSASEVDEPGPFKKLWASRFFTAALGTAPSAGSAAQVCGRFDPELCAQFRSAMEAVDSSDPANTALRDLLREHSPAPTLGEVTAPTYLVQGMSDSLFGLDEADANARGLLDAGAPVAVDWFNGGHDGQTTVPISQEQEGGPPGDDGSTVADEEGDLEEEQFQDVLTWLQGTVAPQEPPTQEDLPLPAFRYVAPPPQGEAQAQAYTVDAYPGLDGVSDLQTSVRLEEPQPPGLVSPPGAVPESLTAVPGVGGVLGGVSTYALAALPGQHVAFDSEPVDEATLVAGAPEVSLQVTSSARQSSLFVSLWEVQPGGPVLPRRLVAPVQVTLTPGESQSYEVALPAGTWQMAQGSTWRVLVSATDSSFRVDPQTRVDEIGLGRPSLTLPVAAGAPVSPPSRLDTETIAVAAALAAVLLVAAVAAWRSRRRPDEPAPQWSEVPLVVSGLSKAYPDGHRAVSDVSWRAERGQVVGLLGPNGAGKTTTLRMVMGLIAQDEGTVHVLGHRVSAGAPVLQRVGALVEGPGFLPHLTGRDNLRAYWAATGRPAGEAHLEEALEIAALGDAVDRPVRSYSHGMRQRLGIAQAMLGMPEVLILDEPTNGLDPPQIAAMRPTLQQYAAAGRTVVVSSHLLAEVEMTCSHVVVMHAGSVLAAGSVEEVGVAEGRNLEEVFLSTIAGAGDGSALNAVRPR
jgi:ABC-2 type transport system ATP-binding protein